MNQEMNKQTTLTLALARQILDAALAAARTAGIPPVAVVVLDAAGHQVASLREDGASMLRIDIAQGKAWAAAGLGVSSRALHGRAQGNPVFFGALAANGKFIPQTGAVVVKNGAGIAIGAVGASGGTGDEDEAICIAGVDAAGLAAA